MLGVKLIAAVAVSNADYGYDRRYKYVIPAELSEKAAVGMRVLIPFGSGNRKRIALIIRIDDVDSPGILEGLKPILSLIDSEPLINSEMLGLIYRLRETTLCTYFDAFKTLIPIGLSVNIAEDGSVKRVRKDDTVRMVKLSDEFLTGNLVINLTQKQKAVIALLEESAAASIKEAAYICGITPQVVNNLVKKGVLIKYEYECEICIPCSPADACADDIALTQSQLSVYNGICGLIDDSSPHAALLHGVTGSGKTPVYAKLIAYVLQKDKTAILMLPEISLTPQTVKRFRSLFGELVAVFHSGLSLTERLNEYKRVKYGNAKIVIGTRSAVFAPLESIGLIIMDEEGERTYKSEASPRYNAREVAKTRCVTHNAVLLMASATPSVESYYYAKTGRYKLFSLPHRYNSRGNSCGDSCDENGSLPEVHIIDLAAEGFYNSSEIFSERLVFEIKKCLERGEQVVLLLNRRGYHTFISCAECKKPAVCVNCTVPLTYHKASGRLHCHYCGYSDVMPSNCATCGAEELKLTGVGTQRAEDEVSALFPDARVLRMDADSASSRYAYEKKFAAFEKGEYDILLGTQMIAKGLDFPNVTLAGILSVDKALFTGDFRSYERTFSLVTQAVGRSGRSKTGGRAFIQTFMPEHYVLNLAAMQDYISFYEQEIAMRNALTLPPFCATCLVEFASAAEKKADAASKVFMGMLKSKLEQENSGFPLRVIGPAKSLHEKINGKYRYRIIFKCKNNSDFRQFIADLYKRTFKAKEFANVTVSIDFNGDISN